MRGQTALEYLITYGWAIVALSVIIMLLFYTGALNPSAWVPVNDRATGLSVFGVTDFSVNGTGTITLFLVNNAQSKVKLTNISIGGSSLTGLSPSLPPIAAYPPDGYIPPGNNLTIKGNSTISGTRGDAFYNTKIEFNYTIYNGASHTDSGMLSGKID